MTASGTVRAVVAVIAGTVVSILMAYLGAIVLLLVRVGIPLGSEAWAPSPVEYAGLLLTAAVAAAIGGHIAAGIAPHDRTKPVITVQAVVLAAGAVWGFSGAASHWPAWWGPALAATAAAGTWLGGARRRPR